MGRRRRDRGTTPGLGDGFGGRGGDSGDCGGGSVMVGDGGLRGDGCVGGVDGTVSGGGTGVGCGGFGSSGFGVSQAADVPPLTMGSAPVVVAEPSASASSSARLQARSRVVAVASTGGEGRPAVLDDVGVASGRMFAEAEEFHCLSGGGLSHGLHGHGEILHGRPELGPSIEDCDKVVDGGLGFVH
ncbi:hypothetical protein Dimus_017663, partial [Dionaea muscipula]